MEENGIKKPLLHLFVYGLFLKEKNFAFFPLTPQKISLPPFREPVQKVMKNTRALFKPPKKKIEPFCILRKGEPVFASLTVDSPSASALTASPTERPRQWGRLFLWQCER